MTDLTDLNAAFGKALLQQFFEPMLTGRGPSGEAYYAPSGVAMMATEMYRAQSTKILEKVGEQLDLDALAAKIADLVVKELTTSPDRWVGRNVHADKIAERVKEIVAQQLGQRVVDHMDLRIGAKELTERSD